MSSINNPNPNETFKREGQFQPDTTTERVASHIPGTDAHAERNELPGRAAPGPHMKANVPATAEYERKHEFQRDMGTGLTNPADDSRDVFGSNALGGAGHKQTGAGYDTHAHAGTHSTSAAEPVGTTARHAGNVPSTTAVQGTAPLHNEQGTRTENRVRIDDKIVGAAERTLGKVLNKPAMVEKGIERQTVTKDVPTATKGGQSGGVPLGPQ